MPEGQRELIAQFYIEVNGSPFAAEKMNDLLEVEVDIGFHMPGVAVLKFYDQDLRWVDDATFNLGTEIKISVKDANGTQAALFKGIVSNLEPEFVRGQMYAIFVVRAYDKSFKLHRGATSKAYLQKKDSDIASEVAQACGLQVEADATTVVHEHIYRHNQSDYEFLTALARRNGYVVYCDSPNGKLQFKKPSSFTTQVVTKYGEDLLDFRPRLAVGGQVNEVTVTGWSITEKKEVVGRATTPGFTSSATGVGSGGPSLAQRAFASAAKLQVAGPQGDQSSAEKVALAVLDRMSSGDMTAEGLALGNAKIVPGCKLKVEHLGTRFSGTYLVTRTRHVFNPQDAYTTEIWMGGLYSGTFASLINDDPRKPATAAGAPAGLMTALVTNNNDPQKYGRVKVKLPTIATDLESNWAPVVSAGAGKNRGLMIIPEVNDEVLVGFADGDVNRPYVLGGLWNGKDAVPAPSAIASGNTEIRELKTRAGHILRFTDSSGGEKIELIDKTGKNSIEIDTSQNTITVTAAKDIVLKAESGNISLKAMNVKIEATAQVQAEGKSQIALKGAIAELSATGMTKISGSMVAIN